VIFTARRMYLRLRFVILMTDTWPVKRCIIKIIIIIISTCKPTCTRRQINIGWTENAGPDNAGPQKRDRKLEDKLQKAITQCN